MNISGMDYGIRQGLVQKGVNNDDIGYNAKTGYVTIKGTDAIKAPKVYNGTSFTNEQDFNNDWNSYQKSLNATTQVNPTTTQGTTTASVTPTQPTYNPYQTNNPYDSQYNDLLKTLMAQAQNPTPVDVNAIYASPQYAARQAQAQRSAQQGIRSAQEALGGAGFGRSTALAERAQGIQNDANEYLETQVLPQLVAAEQASRQQQLQNQFSVLDALMAQQGVYDNRYNNANDLAIRQGQLTGNYMSEQDRAALPLLQQLVQFGQEFGSANADRQAELRNLANTNRATLAAMGIDPSLYDPNLSTEQRQAALGRVGTRTLSGQQQDYAQQADQRDFNFQKSQQEWENAFRQGQFDWQKAQQAWENAFQGRKFEQDMKDAAASRGLQWAQLNQRQKEFVADSAFREKQYQQELGDAAGKRVSGAIEQLQGQYVQRDPSTGVVSVTNPQALRNAVIAKGLSDSETDEILIFFGLPTN